MKQSMNILILIFPFVFQSWGMNTLLWVDAGDDITICESELSVELNALASSYSFVEWSTSGDGFFMLPNELSTFYYPGSGDVSTGLVFLYISVLTEDNQGLTDSLTLLFVKMPVSITSNNASICENEYYQVDGQAYYCMSHTWTTTGDGYFSDPFIFNPVYIPGNNDISTGDVDLCLVSFPNSPCIQPDVSCMVLNILGAPLIEAGNDTMICKYDSYHLAAIAQNYTGILWQTSGDGTFSNPNIPDPFYNPGYNDKTEGFVVLTLTVSSIFPCTGFVSDSLILHIINPPQANAGFNQTICKNQTAHLSGTASNCGGIVWITYGDGSFDDNTILNPVYTPGPNDLISDRVFIELNSFPVAPCTMTVGSFLFVELQNLPQVNAGEDVTTCGDSLVLSGSAVDYEEITWSTSGDGNFSDFTILNPVYYFGPGDVETRACQLMIYSTPVSPCVASNYDELNIVIDIPEIIHHIVEDTVLFTGEDLHLQFQAETIVAGSYQWYFNDIEISGENAPLLIISDVEPFHAGYYQCIFTHFCGEIASDVCMVQIHETLIQEFVLLSGWSGISSYVIPGVSNVDSIFEGISGSVIILNDDSGTYCPDQNLNTLGNWKVPHGYQIKMSEPSILSLAGIVEYPTEKITVPPGWSLLPVNCKGNVIVAEVFDSIPEIEIIKDVAGTNMYWPSRSINTMLFLVPGRAYRIYSKSLSDIFIDFSEY